MVAGYVRTDKLDSKQRTFRNYQYLQVIDEKSSPSRVYFSSQLSNGEGNILLVYESSRALETREMVLKKYRLEISQHEIANLRIFNSCVKKRKHKASSLRTSSAFRKDV